MNFNTFLTMPTHFYPSFLEEIPKPVLVFGSICTSAIALISFLSLRQIKSTLATSQLDLKLSLNSLKTKLSCLDTSLEITRQDLARFDTSLRLEQDAQVTRWSLVLFINLAFAIAIFAITLLKWLSVCFTPVLF